MPGRPMMRRRHVFIAAFAALATLGVWFSPRTHVAAQSLPTAVSDKDFWGMVVGFSEPGGFFRSDNLISNETAFQHVIPELQKIPQPGAYLGVGPDQNFTYITALKPEDGVHRRHPAAEHAAAPDVQGARGAVGRPRRFSVTSLRGRGQRASDPRRARRRCSTRSRRWPGARSSPSSTCARSSITWSARTDFR